MTDIYGACIQAVFLRCCTSLQSVSRQLGLLASGKAPLACWATQMVQHLENEKVQWPGQRDSTRHVEPMTQ